VYFFQDRFGDAIFQATNALPLVKSQQVKSFLLLREGECQQRLGRFTDADQTFRKVEQLYPNSPVAEAARDHEGHKSFYVQLATYDNDLQAEQAINSLQSSGAVISKSTTKGLTIIDAGPYPSYTDAKNEKDKLIKNFPQATIVP
jgi:tetratricopeptide (TPR) repeat protein